MKTFKGRGAGEYRNERRATGDQGRQESAVMAPITTGREGRLRLEGSAALHCLAVVARRLCQVMPNIIVVRCTEQRAPHVVCTRHFPIHGGRVVASIRMFHVECKRARTESEALSNRGVGTTWVRHGGLGTDVPVRVRSVPAHHGTETRVTKQIETQCANAIGRPFHFSIRRFSIKRSAGSN